MTGRQPQLLIVHQSFNMAKTLARLLAKSYGVYIAREASQVLEIIETKEIQIVIASQQLPEGTGMSFLSSLRKSHPEIIRMLLLPGGPDEQLAEQAVSDGTIHFFMVEPLSSSGFLEMVHAGVGLYQGDEGREPVLVEPEGEVLAELSDTVYSEVDRVEDASRSFERMAAERSMRDEFNRVCAGKDTRIEQLEASCAQLRQEKEVMQSQLLRMSEDNSVLAALRKQNEAYVEQITALEQENEELKNRFALIEERFGELEDELKVAQDKLESFGLMADQADEWVASGYDKLRLPDPEDIYERAEEWLLHIRQLHRINSGLVVKVGRGEKEIQELHGRIDQDRSKYDEELGSLKRRIREYRNQMTQLRESAEKQEMRCKQLLRENEGLSQKLDWMQNQWKESVAHSSTTVE